MPPVVLVMLALAQQPVAGPAPFAAPVAVRVPGPVDALGWAAADIVSRLPDGTAAVPEANRRYIRYLWVPPWGDKTWHQATSYAVNSAASQAATIVLPEGVAAGHLIRWDLARLAPKPEQLKALVATWDGLAIDEPYFHVPKLNSGVRVAIAAPYLTKDPATAAHVTLLAAETQSPALVYRADWFLVKLLAQIEGGKYYEFMQYPRNPLQGTEQDALFKTVGADVNLSLTLNGQNRVGIFISEVTAKPRRIDRGQGVVGDWWITHDIFDEDAEVGRHPLYNLVSFFDRGREIIFERQNGLHGYAITDNTGKLVDEAPPNLVADHNIPAPHSKRLHGAISCIACHGPQNGLMPAANDVNKLLGGGAAGDFDYFGDLDPRFKSRQEAIDFAVSAYAGDFDKRLRLGRDNLGDAVFAATQGMSVAEAADAVQDIYYGWRYDKITPQTAAYELGRKFEDDTTAAAWLNKITRPRKADALIEGKPVAFGDATPAALSRGIPVRRFDFDRVYADMAAAALETKP